MKNVKCQLFYSCKSFFKKLRKAYKEAFIQHVTKVSDETRINISNSLWILTLSVKTVETS